MKCPNCGSSNTGDAGAATYKDSVCKDCGKLFDHPPIPHRFRPFTLRDGSTACADCHAPESHPGHLKTFQARPLTRG